MNIGQASRFTASRLLIIAAALLLSSHTAVAIGFGQLKLKSHLGEPLEAIVPLLLNHGESTEQLTISLASPEEYQQMGLPWQDTLGTVRVTLTGRSSRHPIIGVHSVLPLRSPLLPILLRASKPGRATYFKHFQLLLDPGDMPNPRVEAIQNAVPPSHQNDIGKPISIDAQSGLTNGELAAPEIGVSGNEPWSRATRYGPTRRGDNLSEIAYRLRRDKRFTNLQVMLALFERNPKSFVDGNINQLKAGTWLQVPDEQAIRQHNTSQAREQLKKHTRPTPSTPPAPAPAAKQIIPTGKVAGQELRYSGRIGLASEEAMALVSDEIVKQLEPVHNELMAGKLHMGTLDEAVAGLQHDVGGLKKDVGSLQSDVAQLSTKMNNVASVQTHQSSGLNRWMIAFFSLLSIVLVSLLAMAGLRLRRHQAQSTASLIDDSPARQVQVKQTNEQQQEAPAINETTDNIRQESVIDVAGHINRIEELISQCQYGDCEKVLDQLDKAEPDSLRSLALRTQLYHETNRIEERNALISQASDSLDRKHWESFSNMLPSHVWHACFGDPHEQHAEIGLDKS